MATSLNFIEYICDQLEGIGNIRYRKMFGEYMIYVNEKPIVLVCDDTIYVKKVDCIEEQMTETQVGYPYKGAKEHYILDIDHLEFCRNIITKIEAVTPLPKKEKIKNERNFRVCK